MLRKDKEPIRRVILDITKKEPKNPTEISREIPKRLKRTGNYPKPHKIVQNFLDGMVERGLLFRIENSEESKKWMLKKFRKKWKKGENDKEFGNYYFNTENSGSEELRKIFDIFIKKIGDFIEDKNKINEKIKEICKLLSKFDAMNDPSKAKPWKSHKHMKDGSVRFFESKQPIRRLTYQEIFNLHGWLKSMLKEKSKHKKLTSDEEKTLNDLDKKGDRNLKFEDEGFIEIVNEINYKVSKWDSIENIYLGTDIIRELGHLVDSIYSQLNISNILNKITKEVKETTFS